MLARKAEGRRGHRRPSGIQPRSPERPGGGGAGGGGGGIGQLVPAGTVEPSGQVTGAGGGGGGGGIGQGCVVGICDPSGQVCSAGGGGVVAHALSASVVPMKSASRLIPLSFL